jgi:hypothetical protein
MAVVMLAALVAVAALPAEAADLVVIGSTAARHPAGEVLARDAPLRLADGERLTLVGADGKVIRLTGPFNGVPAAGDTGNGADDPAMLQAIARLFEQGRAAQTSVGTMRNAPRRETPPVWGIDVARDTDRCLPATGEALLWRPDGSRELAVLLLQRASGREATVTFAAGEKSRDWPADLPLADGEYAMRDAAGRERTVTIRLIPAAAAGEVERAAWMAENGCEEQARAFLAALAG